MKSGAKRAALAFAGVGSMAGAAWPALASAQTGDEMIAMSKRELRPAVQQRHDAAIAAMAATVNADDPRYIWAMQAKAHCGIALGYLKSGTKDPDSLSKCADAYARMQATPMAWTAPTPMSTVSPEVCRQPILATVFFEFDSTVVPESSSQSLQFIANNMASCRWSGLNAVGHTDRSGSDQYNEGLAIRRANAVASALAASGLAPGAVTTSGRGETEPRVPTPDGVRNPQNRRVEISAR